MVVKNLKEAEERIRKAMMPPQTNQGRGFSPAIQGLRQTAQNRRPATPRRPLPTAGRASPIQAR